MPIAFFDSGIGGLTVLHESLKYLPDEHLLYYADTLHVPYGTKSKEAVKDFVMEAVEDIMKAPVSALVVACNTATSLAVNDLRSRYGIPIIGMEPAVKPAVELNRVTGKRILVFATPITLGQSKFSDLVAKVHGQELVDSLPLPELVEHCENLNFDRDEIAGYFRTKLAPFDLQKYGTVVLGCTHYVYYKSLLAEILPKHIGIVDGNDGTVKHLLKVLNKRPCSVPEIAHAGGNGKITLRCSGGEPAYIRKMEQALRVLSAF